VGDRVSTPLEHEKYFAEKFVMVRPTDS
jgi:hypothetical protein